MSHVIELSDEQYAAIERGAQEQGVSPQAYVRMLAESVRQAQAQRTVYDDLDAMFRALGMTDEQLAESNRMADTWFPPDSGEANEASNEGQSTPGGETATNGANGGC